MATLSLPLKRSRPNWLPFALWVCAPLLLFLVLTPPNTSPDWWFFASGLHQFGTICNVSAMYALEKGFLAGQLALLGVFLACGPGSWRWRLPATIVLSHVLVYFFESWQIRHSNIPAMFVPWHLAWNWTELQSHVLVALAQFFLPAFLTSLILFRPNDQKREEWYGEESWGRTGQLQISDLILAMLFAGFAMTGRQWIVASFQTAIDRESLLPALVSAICTVLSILCLNSPRFRVWYLAVILAVLLPLTNYLLFVATPTAQQGSPEAYELGIIVLALLGQQLFLMICWQLLPAIRYTKRATELFFASVVAH